MRPRTSIEPLSIRPPSHAARATLPTNIDSILSFDSSSATASIARAWRGVARSGCMSSGLYVSRRGTMTRGARPSSRTHFASLGIRLVPAAAAGSDDGVDRRARLAGGDADWRRQIALLPGAGAAERARHRRRIAADFADEGPGGRTA